MNDTPAGMTDDELDTAGPLTAEQLDRLTDREALVYEKGYIAGAAAQWRSLLNQAMRELQSFGTDTSGQA